MKDKQQTAMDRKIGNSDKSLVIYTHDDVIKMMNTFHTSILNRDLCMAKLTPIQLPSDDEINEMGIDVVIYNDTKRGWFVEGLKFMRDKIQGGEQ